MADIPSLASSGLDYQSAPKVQACPDKPEADKLTKIMRGTLPKTSFSEKGIRTAGRVDGQGTPKITSSRLKTRQEIPVYPDKPETKDDTITDTSSKDTDTKSNSTSASNIQTVPENSKNNSSVDKQESSTEKNTQEKIPSEKEEKTSTQDQKQESSTENTQDSTQELDKGLTTTEGQKQESSPPDEKKEPETPPVADSTVPSQPDSSSKGDSPPPPTDSEVPVTPEPPKPIVLDYDVLFVQYIHQQTQQNIPVSLSQAASYIISQGVTLIKNKETKDHLVQLFKQYQDLFSKVESFVQENKPIDLTHLETLGLDFLPGPFSSILPSLISFLQDQKKKAEQEEKKKQEQQKEREMQEKAIQEQIEKEEEKAVEHTIEPIKEVIDIDEVIPMYNIVLVSYSIDLTGAQYRDQAFDLRYTLLTHIDLYKHHNLINDYIQRCQQALNVLRTNLKQYESQQGLSSEYDALHYNSIVIEFDLPVKAYQHLIDYYSMLLFLFESIKSTSDLQTSSYGPIYNSLQHHLASLRMKTPQEVEEYRQLTRFSKPLPTQRIIHSSSLIAKHRKGLLRHSYQPPSDQTDPLVYFVLLAIYDGNPAIPIDDPDLDKLFSMVYLSREDPFRSFVQLSPEQRLQFIDLVNQQQPFSQLTKMYHAKPLPNPALWLEEFIDQNTPPKGCDHLYSNFEMELQFIQSDLKRFVNLFGEQIENELAGYLAKKYECTIYDQSKLNRIKEIVQLGLEGQLNILNQIYKEYPTIVSPSLLSNLFSLKMKSTSNSSVVNGSELEESKTQLTSSQFLYDFIEDEYLPEEKQILKDRLLRLRDFFNLASNRNRVYKTIDLLKKKHIDVTNEEKTRTYQKSIEEFLPDEEDPLRIFLLNYLQIFRSFDDLLKLNAQEDPLTHLRNLPLETQKQSIQKSSFFLLQTALRLEETALQSLKDTQILNQIEFLLYSPQRQLSAPHIEHLCDTLFVSLFKQAKAKLFPEFVKEIETLRNQLIQSVRSGQTSQAINILHTLRKIKKKHIMQDPFHSTARLRNQRLQQRDLSKRVASRLPPMSEWKKEVMLWYILKPWMDSLSHTEYRNFEYFIAFADNKTKESLPIELQRLFGTRVPSHDLGFTYDTHLYRPTAEWWNYFLKTYHQAGSGKCASLTDLQRDLTVAGSDRQRFVLGYSAPGYTAKILTQEDFQRECKWFDSHFTPSQLQFSKWLHQPAENIESSLTPYLENLILQLFPDWHLSGDKQKGSRREDREQLKSKAFVRALWKTSKESTSDPVTVEELLTRFFTVYTFLSKDSVVFGYARSILDVFERASPDWYEYLLQMSIPELFPELTLVEPSVKDQIENLIRQYAERQIRMMYSEAHPGVLDIDLQSDIQKELRYLLQHDVRGFVGSRWCPIDQSISWYLSEADGSIKCITKEDIEKGLVPVSVVQAVKAQLGTTSPDANGLDSMKEDLTIDTDIEMTAIQHFTDIIRDRFQASGELSSSKLARGIAKAHPHPVTGKQLPSEPIRERLVQIADSHYGSLLYKLIGNYLHFHPELFVSLQKERSDRYKRFAVLGLTMEVAENDFEKRKKLIEPLQREIQGAFELKQVDPIEIIRIVEQIGVLQSVSQQIQQGEDDLLPQVCGMCKKECEALRRSVFYLRKTPEHEFFCSLECADKRMQNFQQEPEYDETELHGDELLFSNLLKYYPNRGIFEEGENGLYIPDIDVILPFEDTLRSVASTVSLDLSMDTDLTKVYHGVMNRYYDAYKKVVEEKEKNARKVPVSLVDGCSITLQQVRDFFRQHASRYYDQFISGQFHFMDGVMKDFYASVILGSSELSDQPACLPIPVEVLHRTRGYKLIRQLGLDIERAYRHTVKGSSVLPALRSIYRLKALRAVQRQYPYLSDKDHEVKTNEQLTKHPVEQDIQIAIQLINRFAPIADRLSGVDSFLKKIDEQDPENTGRNRLMKLLKTFGVDISPDEQRLQQGLPLVLYLAKVFPEELKSQLKSQRVVIRRGKQVVDSSGQQVELPKTGLHGLSRKRTLHQVSSNDSGLIVKEEAMVLQTPLEEKILDEQLVTLKELIEHEISELL